jgi:hypothetical protein
MEKGVFACPFNCPKATVNQYGFIETAKAKAQNIPAECVYTASQGD